MSTTTETDERAELTRQFDALTEEALYWRDEVRWCDSLPERTRYQERQAACEAEAAAIRERLGLPCAT